MQKEVGREKIPVSLGSEGVGGWNPFSSFTEDVRTDRTKTWLHPRYLEQQ